MAAALRIPEPVSGYVRMKSGYEKEMALKDSATDAVPGAVMGELAGFTIPRLGMGTMALAIEGRPDRDTAIRAIHAGLNAGVRYLDTAWSYYLPSRPGTGTPEDLGYGEKLVRDALAT